MLWQPGAPLSDQRPTPPSLLAAIGRGITNRCPVCGEGRLFRGFLTVMPACEACGTPLGQVRADDAPPYIVLFLTGHLLIPVIFWVERTYEPPMWLHMAVWLPLFAIVCTLLLRPVKGAVIGWMMRLGLGGADPAPSSSERPHDV